MTRTNTGIWKMPIAVIEVTMPGPNTAASMIADSTAGKAKVKSLMRMISSSVQPRRAAADEPEADAEGEADADRDDADQDGRAGADQQQRDDVAPEHVGAEPMRRGRRLQLGNDVDVVGRPRRPDQRQQRGAEHQQAEHAAEHEAAMAQRAAPEAVGADGSSRRQRNRGGRAHRSCTLMRGSIAA